MNDHLTGLELGCAKCRAPLGIAYQPDRLRRKLCRDCAAAHRAENLRAFEAHRALARALPSIAPHHSPTEHARAASRLAADIGGAE